MQRKLIDSADDLIAGEFIEIEVTELELREDLSGLFSICPGLPKLPIGPF